MLGEHSICVKETNNTLNYWIFRSQKINEGNWFAGNLPRSCKICNVSTGVAIRNAHSHLYIVYIYPSRRPAPPPLSHAILSQPTPAAAPNNFVMDCSNWFRFNFVIRRNRHEFNFRGRMWYADCIFGLRCGTLIAYLCVTYLPTAREHASFAVLRRPAMQRSL